MRSGKIRHGHPQKSSHSEKLAKRSHNQQDECVTGGIKKSIDERSAGRIGIAVRLTSSHDNAIRDNQTDVGTEVRTHFRPIGLQ